MSGYQQYVDIGRGGGGGVLLDGGAVRWEQGTCNASFRDEAAKLKQKQNQNGQNKKVSFVLHLHTK